MLEEAGDILFLSKMMGHQCYNTTTIYLSASAEIWDFTDVETSIDDLIYFNYFISIKSRDRIHLWLKRNRKKITELESIMAQHKNTLALVEVEIFKVISEYKMLKRRKNKRN